MKKTKQQLGMIWWVGLVFFLWLGGVQVVQAQQHSQTSPEVEEVQDLPSDPTTFLLAAQKVVLWMDSGSADRLWSHVSEVVQQSFDEKEFIGALYSVRRPLGVLTSRSWKNIIKEYPAELEGGVYVTVIFDSVFAGGVVVQEQVVFRQDADGVWRISGYVLR